jgi:hypothetical protein
MMKRLYTYISILLLLISSGVDSVQAQEVISKAETDTMLIGDQQWISFEVSTSEQARLNAPLLHSDSIKGIEVLDGPLVDTLISDSQVILKYKFKITSFDSGDYKIPALPILFFRQDSPDTLLTEPISFRVNTLEVDTAKAFKPIKGPIEAPLTFAEALPFILIGLGIILLVIIVYILIRKISNKERVLPRIERPLEAPHIEAKKALDKLKGKDLSTKEQVKAYYTELSEITRYYIWRRLHVKTLEKTSDEIYQGLQEINFKDREAIKKLRSIFTTSDYVKFAKYIPAAHEHDACLKMAYEFVDLTKPEEKDEKKATERTDSEEKQLPESINQKEDKKDV